MSVCGSVESRYSRTTLSSRTVKGGRSENGGYRANTLGVDNAIKVDTDLNEALYKHLTN